MTSVGDGIKAGSASWTFAGDVAKGFDDHVSKSVPLYEEGHHLTCELSDFFNNICAKLTMRDSSLLALLTNDSRERRDGLHVL